MSDADEREAIRRQKIEELRDGDGSGGGDTTETEVPAEPFAVDGASALKEAVERYDVVLADFYADWCGPCQMLEPIVEGIAADTDAAVAKVDVDANQSLAAEYGVQGVPTLVLFADGSPVERLVGMQDEGSLRQTVEAYS